MLSLAVCTPIHKCDPQLAIAALRAGHLGILDLSFADESVRPAALQRLAEDAHRYTAKVSPVNGAFVGTSCKTKAARRLVSAHYATRATNRGLA